MEKINSLINNQINQIKINNKLNQINQINNKESVEKPKPKPKDSYDAIARTIDALPFPISAKHRNLVAWQYKRIGRTRFLEIASDTMKNAYNPEPYFMSSLKKEKG